MKFFSVKQAFTLAEVLITLAVIGIVAAMTIPTIINTTQEREFRSAWKKNYSMISQAVQYMVNENSGSLVNVLQYETTTLPEFEKHLPFLKTGVYSDTDEVCWDKDYTSSGGTLNGWERCVVLKDGSLLLFKWYAPSCDGYVAIHPAMLCQQIYVDVNGLKGPNKDGKDIFGLWVEKNKVTPIGTAGDHINFSQCNSNGGLGCAAKYLYSD